MVAELGKPARTRDLQKHHSGTSSSYRTCSPRRKRLALSACLHPPFFFAFEFLYLDITYDLICTLRLFLNQRCGVEGVRKNPRDTPISSLPLALFVIARPCFYMEPAEVSILFTLFYVANLEHGLYLPRLIPLLYPLYSSLPYILVLLVTLSSTGHW